MAPTSPWPALICLGLAVATAAWLARRFGAPETGGRHVAIDGLRGFLAFFVFLHHSCIWYFYARNGQWVVPNSNLFVHFGQSSVALFFMITGFLFFSKLLAGRTRPVDWGRLYISRILRLVPLYFLVLVFLFLIVAFLSGGTAREPVDKLFRHGFKWITFTLLGAPDLNGVEQTSVIVAGVTWSLAYEWLFYLSLPVLALLIGAATPPLYVTLGVVSAVWFALWKPELNHLLPFLGGITSALASRITWLQRACAHRLSTVIPLSCLVVLIRFFPSSRGAVPLLLLSLIFLFVACGNSIFGLLTTPAALTLGAMAYGIYLVHGITLFLVFHSGLGVARTRLLAPEEHWLIVAGITPVLVMICFLTHRYVERPAMQYTEPALNWLRARKPFSRRAA